MCGICGICLDDPRARVDSAVLDAMSSSLASFEMNKPLATFSVVFADQYFDESRYARMVAQRYGTEHHELVVRDLEVPIFSDLVGYIDEPFAATSAIPTYYVAREARRFVNRRHPLGRSPACRAGSEFLERWPIHQTISVTWSPL